MSKQELEFNFQVSRSQREEKNKHKGSVIWLTGLSGSGKSTIANIVQTELFRLNYQVVTLDGDSLRKGLCKDLDFTTQGRSENIRRVAEVAKLFASNGIITICSFITPLEEQRRMIAEILGGDFHLAHVKASLNECISRDPKGLYKMAEEGRIENFTGVSSPYQQPVNVKITMDTSTEPPRRSAEKLLGYIQKILN